MDENWYRNTTWNSEIERSFNEKLSRARRKESRLRIQACTLARSYPQVALDLLDRYFALQDDFDHAQAFVDRATALLSLERIDEAIDAYNAALKREAQFPNLLTQAYLDLPCLIAVRRIQNQYGRGLDLREQHKSRLMFPVDHFRWHSAHALISAELGQATVARTYAANALSAAEVQHSGFRYHPTVGLVTQRYDALIEELNRIAKA